MSSKWIDGDLFDKFATQKKNEKDKPKGFTRRSELTWKNPQMGTVERAKIYEGRFVPDPKGQFYKKYYYHMFQTGEKWTFFLCSKTYNFDNYCPFCSVTSKLYTGTKADKDAAYNFKRKEKFVSNWYVEKDPRDAEVEESEDKVEGTVRAYEFPGKLEEKLKEQITDTRNGLGMAIFDPGEDGFSFLIKVKATKKDKRGKEWPDYGLSEFSRRSSAIGTDKEIEAIMKQTIDLDEYIESMEKDDEDIMAALKSHMLWDLVSSEWKKAKVIAEEDANDDIPEFEAIVEKVEVKEEDPPFDVEEKDEQTDDELLRELEGL